MDVLTQMLTDSLDPKEENVDQITEECMLGNCRVNLPEDLLEDVSCYLAPSDACTVVLASKIQCRCCVNYFIIWFATA